MPATDSSGRYTSTAIILHWAIAACILFNLAVGFFMEGLDPDARKIVVGLHVSSGMTVLALTAIRIVWRLTHAPPPFFPGMQRWQVHAAHAVHVLLYLMMVVMPVTGWMFLSAHPPRPGAGVRVWGLFTVPPIEPIAQLKEPLQKQFHDQWVGYHSIGAWILILLLVIHVAAALKHQWREGHPELSRMGIGRKI
jgi:cytochrome b561